MSESSKRRRLLDEIGGSPSFLSETTRITGDFETDGSLVMCGRIRGDGRVGGALRMPVHSSWEGEVHAKFGIVAGRITGKLVVEERLEIGATAVLKADVSARSIAIAKGAVIEGAVTVTSGEAVKQFEEKRKR
jgi:cytoskeletal protein CcmA (bactofilin family)